MNAREGIIDATQQPLKLAMDEFARAGAALRGVTPRIVARYREAGILTWALLYKIEAEIVAELVRTGEYDPVTLNIFRASDAMGYPKDETPASFKDSQLVPVIFGEIEEAWLQVH